MLPRQIQLFSDFFLWRVWFVSFAWNVGGGLVFKWILMDFSRRSFCKLLSVHKICQKENLFKSGGCSGEKNWRIRCFYCWLVHKQIGLCTFRDLSECIFPKIYWKRLKNPNFIAQNLLNFPVQPVHQSNKIWIFIIQLKSP